jgi:hypothetical protein
MTEERLVEERYIEGALPGESATARAAEQSLKGQRRGLSRLLPFLGPAFIASVAYIDPGTSRPTSRVERSLVTCYCG